MVGFKHGNHIKIRRGKVEGWSRFMTISEVSTKYNLTSDTIRVGQIESTVVSPEYRGNGLQNIICDILEGLSRENCDKMIAATVYPENTYSLNTFKKRGYKVMADKLKYGGLRRYVMMKEI